MISLHEGFNHDKIDKLNKIAQPLFVPIGDFQQINSLFFLSSDKIHGLLLYLLPKSQLFLLIEIFLVAFLLYIILHLPHNSGHAACNDIFVLSCSSFSNTFLFKIEFIFLPKSVLSNST